MKIHSLVIASLLVSGLSLGLPASAQARDAHYPVTLHSGNYGYSQPIHYRPGRYCRHNFRHYFKRHHEYRNSRNHYNYGHHYGHRNDYYGGQYRNNHRQHSGHNDPHGRRNNRDHHDDHRFRS